MQSVQLIAQLFNQDQLLHVLFVHLLALGLVAFYCLEQNVCIFFNLVYLGTADSQIMDLSFVCFQLVVGVGDGPFMFAIEGELFG